MITVIIKKCNWCGKKFEPHHHNEKYCTPTCRKYARQEQNREKSIRCYHKHKHELTEKQRYGLGTGILREHRNQNFDKELKSIQNEKKRLRIK